MSVLDRIKQWFRSAENTVERDADAGEPATTAAAGTGDDDRETSTNAQVEGASGEPWPR
jgi:hypothetical protein